VEITITITPRIFGIIEPKLERRGFEGHEYTNIAYKDEVQGLWSSYR
jgi:hypothetical protein